MSVIETKNEKFNINDKFLNYSQKTEDEPDKSSSITRLKSAILENQMK